MQIDPRSTGATTAWKKGLDASRLLADKLVSSSTPESSRDATSAVVSPVDVVPSAERPAFAVEISDEALARQEKGTGKKEVTSANQLSAARQVEVRELQQRDAEVRTHENAHASAGGALAGAPRYEYQQGPDGRQYAVGGEVPIRIQEGATPEETLRIASRVRAAALAPSEPSSADLSVAASATSLELKARNELSEERLAELSAGSRSAGEAAAAGDAPRSQEEKAEVGAIDPRVRDYGQASDPARDALTTLSFFG